MSADMIERYLEWRQENEGKPVDVSPKAFALQEALRKLVDQVEDQQPPDADILVEIWVGDLVDAYRELHADG